MLTSHTCDLSLGSQIINVGGQWTLTLRYFERCYLLVELLLLLLFLNIVPDMLDEAFEYLLQRKVSLQIIQC